MNKAKTKYLAMLGLLLFSMTANATLIDFEVDSSGSCYNFTCSNVQGYDFTFTAGGWAVSDDGNSFFNRNGKALSEGLAGAHGTGNGAPPIEILMTLTGGGTFDLASLDAATGSALFAGNTSIDLVGTLFGGGTVTQTLTASNIWTNYSLSGFTNLTQLVFRNVDADAGISIDNLNSDAAAVPEPATLALLGLGLAGIGFARRKKA